MDGRLDTLAINLAVARAAARQHGTISRGQLRALGLSPDTIDGRLRRGWLFSVHRGVYSVGHRRLTARGRWMAAVLACGSGAALSHASAAALWDLRGSDPPSVHVTVPSHAGRARRPGITIHRSRTLDASQATVLDTIPVTTVARTLLDSAGDLAPSPLRRVVERSLMLRLFDLRAVETSLAANPTRRGVRMLSSIVANLHDEPQLTRSRLEERFVELCDAHGVPRPEPNQELEGFIVDFLWRRHRLIAETDGRTSHGTPMAFERDRARDAALTVAGYRVVRFTYRQIVGDRVRVARTLLALLTTPVAWP